MPVYHLGSFFSDVTPPAGHPLCGGWIEPVRGVDDPLFARGIIVLGAAAPIVYEPTVALAAPCEEILTRAITKVLDQGKR